MIRMSFLLFLLSVLRHLVLAVGLALFYACSVVHPVSHCTPSDMFYVDSKAVEIKPNYHLELCDTQK